MKPVRIIIFAKAPQPGYAKTRLIPALGAQGAADLARRMFADTLSRALAASVGTVELCVTPSVAYPVWKMFAIPDAVQWSEQGGGDLGERMARAARRVIEAGESVLLVGTDCPGLSAGLLRQAAGTLQCADATLLPTFDGGYALLGLNRFDRSLFTQIAWSTHTVAADTLARLSRLGWEVCTGAMLHDIDEPADLARLPDGWMPRPNA
jgi:rSAM/selenodomain-associated transferase 1